MFAVLEKDESEARGGALKGGVSDESNLEEEEEEDGETDMSSVMSFTSLGESHQAQVQAMAQGQAQGQAQAGSSQARSAGSAMAVTVTVLGTGKAYSVGCDPSDTVLELKNRLSQVTGYPPAMQKLVYAGAGRQLQNGRQLSFYGIEVCACVCVQ